MKLAYLSVYTLYVLMIISFIVSLTFCFRKENPYYLKIFPLYHLLGLTTELIVGTWFSDDGLVYNNHLPYNLFSCIEFLLITLFIVYKIKRKKLKILLGLAAFLVMLSLIITNKQNILYFENWKLIIPVNIYFIFASLVFYHDFLNDITINISESPSFWIITGVLLYSIIQTPIMALVVQLFKPIYSTILYSTINTIGYGSLHLFLIKAYTCRIKKLY